MRKVLKILLLLFLFNTSAKASVPRHLLEFKEIKDGEPGFAQIVRMYFKNEGLSNDHFRKWEKRIKKAPLLPTLYVGLDHALKESQELSINDNISISSGAITVGPEDHDFDFGASRGTTLRLRAVWRLDELVFNRDHFILYREKRALARDRADLGEDLYKIYEQRYMALIQYLRLRRISAGKAAVFYARYRVLTDRLNAMTGGVFRKRWWRLGR